jgi:hypothetical protein
LGRSGRVYENYIDYCFGGGSCRLGYTIGYHRGAHDTFAIFRPHHFVSEVTTLHKTAINTAPDIVTTNTIVGK